MKDESAGKEKWRWSGKEITAWQYIWEMCIDLKCKQMYANFEGDICRKQYKMFCKFPGWVKSDNFFI